MKSRILFKTTIRPKRQSLKPLTEILISMQRDINVYRTSKLHEEIIVDTVEDNDDDNSEKTSV